MLQYIEVNVCNSRLPRALPEEGELPSITDMTYYRETIEVLPKIHDDVYNLYIKFSIDRYDYPGTLVLGWKTWIQLSYAMSEFENLGCRIDEWRGITIIVDDSTPDWIQFLPKLKDVMMGGYNFVG